MKITQTKKAKEPSILFKDVKPGTVFRMANINGEYDKWRFLKIVDTLNTGSARQAIWLVCAGSTGAVVGSLCSFDANREVAVMDAELIIKGDL